MSDWKEHFKRAIEEAGSQPKLAVKLGCSQQKISWLLNHADTISVEDALLIERATGGIVTARALRPDFWKDDDVQAAERVA